MNKLSHALSTARQPLVSRRAFAALLGAGAASLALSACSDGSGEGKAAPAEFGAAAVGDTREGEKPAAARQYEQISNTIFVFDTVVTLTASCAHETLQAACERCEYFESIFSRTIEDSDIGRINAAGGKPVTVAQETADIISRALAYCEASDGRFDITIGAVTTLWDFKEGVVPDADDIAEAVTHIDWRGVSVEGTQVTLADPLAKLDLGGIAKGYIADDLAKFFLDAGCDSACINLGGNVKTVGVKPDGSLWHVGIQDPNDVEGAVIAVTDSHGTSVVTSGLYERQFTKDGKRYWHILDPKTGYPVETDLVSATIISDASIDGDGNTKPLFMMGAREALEWLNGREGIEGFIVTTDGEMMQTDGNIVRLLDEGA